jgi:hypothetical protein
MDSKRRATVVTFLGVAVTLTIATMVSGIRPLQADVPADTATASPTQIPGPTGTPTATNLPQSTGSPTPAPTGTSAPTPTATPTSFRIADVAVTIDDDTDPVYPGVKYHYLVTASNHGPSSAPNGTLQVTIPVASPVTFTGTYTSTTSSWTCELADPHSVRCHSLMVDGATLGIQAEVASVVAPGTVRACAEIDFLSPGGGIDPNPANNGDCEDTILGGVGDLGWRKVVGVVYASEASPGRELAGASVTCSQFSYYPRPGSCEPHAVTTGSDGTFAFDVFVHDTDRITITAKKSGFQTDAETMSGLDCFARCPELDLVLPQHEWLAFLPITEVTTR